MAKVITFLTPAADPKTTSKIIIEERRGTVALLDVGGAREKFVLQFYRESDKVEALVHYASGYKLGDLNPIKVRHARSYSTLTDRAAAEVLIAEIVRLNGADEVRRFMATKRVLNPTTAKAGA